MDDYEKSKICTKRHKKLKTLLKIIYGYDNFRPKQYEILNRIFNGEDICGILATGYGKSICFQIPALYLNKPAVIVVPLISLMDDQRMILEKLGITSCCFNSTVYNKYELKKSILNGEYKFVYITAEAVINQKEFLITLNERLGISVIAIDEAHCISSYGYDFRPAYRKLTFFKEILPDVPILAVTATATNVVADDICKVLKFKLNNIIKNSFDRPNLYIEIREKSKPKNIATDILPILAKHVDQCVIIYCITINETGDIAEILKLNKLKCKTYHSKLDNDKKTKVHHDFVSGKVKIIIATIAFGMGINKSNVRAVIHYGCPKNIEGYYQEIGRAGRDGLKSSCYTIYSYQDFKRQEFFISGIVDDKYKKNQTMLLNKIKNFMINNKICRRSILLEYFNEDYKKNNCESCDICCGVTKTNDAVVEIKQDVSVEARMLIDLIDATKPRRFGLLIYIDVLRGASNKKILKFFPKNKFYGKGKHRSANWWKEMGQNLIDQEFLMKTRINTGNFPTLITEVAPKGITWANIDSLNILLDTSISETLDLMSMSTCI